MLRWSLILGLFLLVAPPARAQPAPAALRGGIVINEILVDPNGSANFDTDGDGTAAAADEFVELYNAGVDPVDMGGLELWDPGAGMWFAFPDGTVVAPAGYAVVVMGVQSGGSLPGVPAGSHAFDAGRGSGVINNGGDNVILYDPPADAYVQVWVADDPVDPESLAGFSATAQPAGPGEDFGQDRDGVSRVRVPDGGPAIEHHDDVAATNASPGRAPGDTLAITLNEMRAAPVRQVPAALGAALLTILTAGWFIRQRAAWMRVVQMKRCRGGAPPRRR